LVFGGRLFGHFELKLLSIGMALYAVVAGLIFGSTGGDIGRDLLEEIVDS